jgi:hypothetical protein
MKFTVGPSDMNIQGVTSNNINIGIVANTVSTIYIARSLLLADYSILPLTGFPYSYSINGLPSWASFDSTKSTIKALVPNSFVNHHFSISYNDKRNKSNKISVTFFKIENYSNNIFNFFSLNNQTNFFTLAFPIFSTTSNTLTSIKSSNYGSLTNIAQFPWTNTITLIKNSINFPYLVINATGTYVFGVLVSNSGFFTNSSGTYLNGVYQGNSGYTTSATGTYLNGNYMGAAGFGVFDNQVYFGGSLLSSTLISNNGYLKVTS